MKNRNSQRAVKTCPQCGKTGAHGIETHIKYCGMSIADRFWPKVDKRGPDECWEWNSARNPRGYGHFVILRQDYRAHRISYELANGPIPEGMHVMHMCDNPPCVNPAHLRLGDHTENMHDMRRKDRDPRVTLTVDDVRHIRAELAANDCNDTRATLADRYKVKRGVIWAVASGKTFRYVK